MLILINARHHFILETFFDVQVNVLLHELLEFLFWDFSLLTVDLCDHIHEFGARIHLILEIFEFAPETVGGQLVNENVCILTHATFMSSEQHERGGAAACTLGDGDDLHARLFDDVHSTQAREHFTSIATDVNFDLR